MDQNSPFKKSFLEEEIDFYRTRGKLLLFFAITLVPIFSGLDYLSTSQYFYYFLKLRILDTLKNIVIFLFLNFYKDISLKLINILISIFCCSLSFTIAHMCGVLGGYSSPYYAGIMLVLTAMGFIMPWQAGYAAINCLIAYIGYLFLAYTPESSLKDLVNNSYFLLSIMFMATVSTYFGNKLRFKEVSLRQELEDKNKRLLILDQEKTIFFANLTHEFRTPLVSLSTVLQALQHKVTQDAPLEKLLQTSYASLLEMTENINDLLTTTRAQQGFLEMRWARLDFVEFIEKLIEVFRPLVEKKHLQLIFDNKIKSLAGEPLNSFFYYGDRSKLKKIFNNLLANAIKFTESGSIAISLETKGDRLVICVQDTGIGIPATELKKVFEPFTQASNNILRDVQGTGLGLSIVSDFVKAHHGEISVVGRLGEGSRFTISFPLGDEHVDKTKLDFSEVIEEETVNFGFSSILKTFEELDLKSFDKHRSGQPHLLIVEDTLQVIQALAYVLKNDYNLSFARDGEEGFEKIRILKPDLIISDIMMPKKDGYELLEMVKQDPQLKKIPFVLLTAKMDLESRLRGLKIGADEYISKPFNNLEVKTRIKNLLDRKKIEIEFIHAEKMIALGQLVAGISHEILNPISYAKSAADNILKFYEGELKGTIPKKIAKENLEGAIKRAQEGIRRVCGIVEALKGFVRQGYEGFSEEDLHQGLESTLKIIHINHKNKIHIHQNFTLRQKVYCNINQLNQVFLNLLINATQAMANQEKADLWIETSQREEYAVIVIRDSGPGIPKSIQDKIFDPFFTTKELGKGTGLGLYISQQIMHEHNGWLSVKSVQGGGTQFTIYIPVNGAGGKNGVHSFTHGQIDRRMAQIQYPHRR